MLRLLMFMFVLVLLVPSSYAEIPHQINYQGFLTDSLGDKVPDGNYSLTFRIYDDSTVGSELWSEGHLVPVHDGLFTVLLGSINPIPLTVFDTDAWLSIQVGLEPEILPRTKFSSVAYSYKSILADTATTSLDKTIDASELSTGTLDTLRYSAYDDLLSEDKIGDQVGQLAEGDHSHSTSPLKIYTDTSTIEVSGITSSSNEVVLKEFTIPAGELWTGFNLRFVISGTYTGSNVYPEIIVRMNGQTVLQQSARITVGEKVIADLDCLYIESNSWTTKMHELIPDITQDGYLVNYDRNQNLTISIRAKVISLSATWSFKAHSIIFEYH